MNEQHEYEEEDFEDGVSFFDEDFEKAAEIPDRYAMPVVEELLDDVIEILAEARPLPMSATVKVNRDEVLHMLEQIQDKLPDELRAARWLLKERDDFVSKAKQEHRDLIDEGRSQVARMIEREQVVKAAEIRARQIISDARHESNTMKRQVEEFCEGRLANIEKVMVRTVGVLRKGRERLGASANSAESEDFSVDVREEQYPSDVPSGSSYNVF